MADKAGFSLRKFFLGNIRRKLILLSLLVVLLPLCLTSFLALYSFNNSIEESNLKYIEGIEAQVNYALIDDASWLASNIESNKDDYDAIFESIVDDRYDDMKDILVKSSSCENPADCLDENSVSKINLYFKDVLALRNDEVEAVRLFSSKGCVVAGVVFSEIDVMDCKNTKSWFKQSMDKRVAPEGSNYISEISISDRTKTPVIRFVKPVDVNGERIGLFVVNFKQSVITGDVDHYLFYYYNTGFAELVDTKYMNNSGVILPWPVTISKTIVTQENFGDYEGHYAVDESVAAQSFFNKDYFSEDSGNFGFKKDGTEYMGAYKKLNLDEGEMYLVIAVGKEDALMQANSVLSNSRALSLTFSRNLGIMILTIIFFVVALGYIIYTLITQPIGKIQNAMEKIKAGNYGTRLDISTGDELENLANSINITAKVLSNSEDEHRQLDRAKTEFLSITSHELRSPMTPMRAQLQMLSEGYFGKLTDKQKEAIDIVLRNAMRLDRIIMDFLEVSRIEAARLKFNFVKVNLESYIVSLVKEMDNFLPEKKIKIALDMGKLPVIEVDPDRTMQVLRNLINNAKKFSPESSTIEVKVSVEDEHILFSVKDSGIGIAVKDQLRLFEPFFQAEQTMYRQYGGTGLGLTICKGIIESQKGKIWIESDAGKGTKIYFTVPFSPTRELKPIKLLFSQKESISGKVEALFKEILGPLGEKEFVEFERKKGISKENLLEYIKYLEKIGIINKQKYIQFSKEIDVCFEG